MPGMQKITPCVWCDDQAEEAVEFYTAIFRHSKIVKVARYGEAGHEVHGKPAGTVMIVAFELDGQAFAALNGGPMFTFNEAISLQVHCEAQAEVDYDWEKLCGRGGHGPAVRLAQGQIRHLLAGGAQRVARDAQ
jgi:predicted 3-demethylubiquinone-9 3-methyltransferase (glyoxalase superfamily)